MLKSATRSHGASGPRKERHAPSDEVDEAPSLIDQDQTDVERDLPLDGNEPVERGAPGKAERPLFDE
ncbi:hypothetical protein BE61_84470 [Bradyrhizobium elkanii USDA 61]|jgi:hypothetical protein|nr:hypothetical protein BE61_84470 [Bradyrhizobium elkanii USDA 61]